MTIEHLTRAAIPLLFLLLWQLESRRPARAFEPVADWHRTGGLFFGMALLVGAITPLAVPAAWLARHSLVQLEHGTGLGAVVGVLASTFVGYWLHRAFHRFDSLWLAAHQLHHAARRVDLVGAFFAHPLEVVLKVGFSTIVSTGALGLNPDSAALVSLFVAATSMFQHTNIHTPRWLGFFIQRPESHCLHHEHNVHARNYSDLPLWDIVFGTFENPPAFAGKVGFQLPRPPRIRDLLLMRDVNAGVAESASAGSQ